MLYKIILLLTGLCFVTSGCTSSANETDSAAIKTDSLPAAPLMEYWDTQRKGTNFFNNVPNEAWFDAAAAANMGTIRFVYDKWEGRQRDFLIGNADDYTGLVKEEVVLVRHYLNYADSLGLKVVLTPLSLPGARYVQNNNGQRDYRLWQEETYQLQAAQFWKDMAAAFGDHPAVVGLNLINEPHPEKSFGIHDAWGVDFVSWYDTIRGTPADLNLFNRRMIDAIRSEAPTVPIVVESGLFSAPATFAYLEKLEDEHLLYSFHSYELYRYTTRRLNKGEIHYPGPLYVGFIDQTLQMNRGLLDSLMQPVRNWAAQNEVPANRIYVSEFGGDRMSPGAPQYFADLIDLFNEAGWHWTFYTFREDTWESMDYELGTKKPHYKYWEYQDAGNLHEHYREVYGRVKDQELWAVFKKEF